MADFRPGGLAASVHPCAHSAVRVGFPTPFLSGCRLTPTGAFAADSHTASSDMIYFPAPFSHETIIIVHHSPGKVNVREKFPAPYRAGAHRVTCRPATSTRCSSFIFFSSRIMALRSAEI